MLLILFLCAVLLFLGFKEQKKHQKCIDLIPLRINVNGIRGKSTVTRLITGILTAAGMKTIGKTTGTSARMIYWWTNDEKPIVRRREGANIGEQRRVVYETARLGAEALVCECMAVNPDYQVTFQQKLIQANIGVIVNVLEDHMDVMGPTLDNVAEAFTATIPYNGYLIVSQGPYVEYFKSIALQRKTKVIVADTSVITEKQLAQFDYVIFPENVALALAVAKALDIDEETAWKGMIDSNPDPGILRITNIGSDQSPTHFVNGFAANDAASTLNIWKRVAEIGYSVKDPILIMNCRPDRVDRTIQFARDVFPYIETGTLVIIGESIKPVIEAYESGKIPAKHLLNLEGRSAHEVFQRIKGILPNSVVYGVGNIHGCAEELIEIFDDMRKDFVKEDKSIA